MGQWQSKFLLTVILYGAGFVTAVYLLTPCPAQAAEQVQVNETSIGSQVAIANAAIDTYAWAVRIRAGIDTGINFAEDNALRVADVIRSKMRQGTNQSRQVVLE